MNSFTSLGRGRGGRFGFLAALALAAGLIAMSILAGTASAGSVSCSGKVTLDSEHHADNSLKYAVQCNEDTLGYSIVSNREIGYFSTETTVFAGEEVAEGESFTCEGAIPSNGIGCYGKMAAGHRVEGFIGTSEKLCEANHQPKFWAVALTSQLAKEVPFYLTSEPFPLSISCKTLNAEKKAKAKAQKVCAKVKKARSKKARTAAKQRCKAANKAVKALRAA